FQLHGRLQLFSRWIVMQCNEISSLTLQRFIYFLFFKIRNRYKFIENYYLFYLFSIYFLSLLPIKFFIFEG
ncbi:MAG: hypothetical protein AAB940_01375, partial [Patescibacteria group bacterium]